ncbi:MAG: hypothetical protein IAG10_14510 [Planctomycetaceae bacterium]|nr:hypothetical protein [Planctomycetaceae bacterium]
MTTDPNFSARCPHCEARLHDSAGVASDPGRNSAHGDLAVCFSCATLLEFTEHSYQLASATRLVEIPQDLLKHIEKTLHREVRTVPA